jgi:hypothetical protein
MLGSRRAAQPIWGREADKIVSERKDQQDVLFHR